MRILHVIQELPIGGAEIVVWALATAARDAGHEVAVAAAPGPLSARLGEPQFDLPIVRRRPLMLLQAARKIRGVVRTWNPHVVHAHNPAMALATALAARRGRTARCLVTVHGLNDRSYPVAALLLRCSGMPVVACGATVADSLRDSGLLIATTIRNGIPPAPPAADRATLLEEWGLSDSMRLAVSVGRLVPEKGHETVIRALRAVPDTALAVVGVGPQQRSLRALVSELGVADRVAFVGYRPDARAIMGMADVIVTGTRGEGLSLAVLEAMASGTPLVGTNVRGVRELVTHGREGLLAPPGDFEAMAAFIQHILTDSSRAAELTVNALDTVRGYTEHAMVGRYLDLYAKLTR
jgi:glycosyltransferase involved in cell wall biosynthesis